jgi:hypothetical protein
MDISFLGVMPRSKRCSVVLDPVLPYILAVTPGMFGSHGRERRRIRRFLGSSIGFGGVNVDPLDVVTLPFPEWLSLHVWQGKLWQCMAVYGSVWQCYGRAKNRLRIL